ncbi:fused (3R)-hydroxyacyl-ACP dehydratase subunits HadA/HadB [Nocardia donostiensis]|uniref:(R)-hydratase n=1 Tax=Nocardia donostiensis TaxID=1538463 RepID=A0A1W0ATG8_9NOCA|nr:fused (3R)-hydroxyacyl-ACP dehydratase subunits HadA/HadB [Nocardia donostiensis]ONM49498.1 (R)-hydratase [Nocardia donostiensis]OQS13523.1 (R)-hydratase [Nocardia donostiensis]OQS19975.1 (R)-hydratase [Nocardia donostiensis]
MGRQQASKEPGAEVVPAAALNGRRFRVRDHYEVGREKIREFARAVQNRHPAHRQEERASELGYDALIAPPTFPSVIGMAATSALLDSVLTDYDLSQVLQTDQVFYMHRPMLAGDRIVSEVEITSIRQFGDGDFIHISFVLSNQDDEPAVVGSTTVVARRGAQTDPRVAEAIENIMMHGHRPARAAAGLDELDLLVELEPRPADAPVPVPPRLPVHTAVDFDTLSVGDELALGTVELTRGDLVNYAGVSADANPIHFSEHAASVAGLPDVVAHGLLTMGLAAGQLASWLDDPTAIEKLSVRFAGFVPVAAATPSVIDFTGKIKALDPDQRMATVVLGGRSGGRKIFGRAIAEVRFS